MGRAVRGDERAGEGELRRELRAPGAPGPGAPGAQGEDTLRKFREVLKITPERKGMRSPFTWVDTAAAGIPMCEEAVRMGGGLPLLPASR